MVSLIDIGELRDTVTLRGSVINVQGITAEHIVAAFNKFPEIRMILTQVAPDRDVISQLVAKFPDAVAALIAAACGMAEDDQAIAMAKTLTIGEQYEVLSKVSKLTFPQGLTSFLDGVQGLLKQSNGGLGWAPATTSPGQSNGASPQAAPSETAGDQPQGS